jgi:F5/8 type C domain/Glycosyl transferase family 2
MPCRRSRGRVALAAIARWETQYAPEWLAYHREIGFDHVYLICNDDDPSALWEAVLPFAAGPAAFVTFTHFPWRCHRFHMLIEGLRQAAEAYPWVMILDLDEFLHLPDCHDIERWLEPLESEWDVVHFNRIGFGNSGFVERPPGGVLRTYVRRQSELTPCTRPLMRSAGLMLDPVPDLAPIWTDPSSILIPAARQADVLGRVMPEPPRPPLNQQVSERIQARALVHHYQFKSEQDFLLRPARGEQGAFGGQALWRRLYEEGQHRAILAELNAVEDRSLAHFWDSRLTDQARRSAIWPKPEMPNLALGKAATQSSVSEWSRSPDPAEDAAGLVNGILTGGYQCHTRHEDRPWWRVDLGSLARVHEIRVFNRCDSRTLAERVRAYEIAGSQDGGTWLTLVRQEDGPAFGGADGNPLVLCPPSPVPARYVRFIALSHTNLHLDQVEVYGHPDPHPAR